MRHEDVPERPECVSRMRLMMTKTAGNPNLPAALTNVIPGLVPNLTRKDAEEAEMFVAKKGVPETKREPGKHNYFFVNVVADDGLVGGGSWENGRYVAKTMGGLTKRWKMQKEVKWITMFGWRQVMMMGLEGMNLRDIIGEEMEKMLQGKIMEREVNYSSVW